MNLSGKKQDYLQYIFEIFKISPEIDSLAPIVSENAFSGVLGGRSGHFFIERRMQVLDRK